MDQAKFTIIEVVEMLGVDESFVRMLESHALVGPQQGRYSEPAIERIRISWSLHDELGVNAAGIEVILNLLERLQYERICVREVLRELGH